MGRAQNSNKAVAVGGSSGRRASARVAPAEGVTRKLAMPRPGVLPPAPDTAVIPRWMQFAKEAQTFGAGHQTVPAVEPESAPTVAMAVPRLDRAVLREQIRREVRQQVRSQPASMRRETARMAKIARAQQLEARRRAPEMLHGAAMTRTTPAQRLARGATALLGVSAAAIIPGMPFVVAAAAGAGGWSLGEKLFGHTARAADERSRRKALHKTMKPWLPAARATAAEVLTEQDWANLSSPERAAEVAAKVLDHNRQLADRVSSFTEGWARAEAFDRLQGSVTVRARQLLTPLLRRSPAMAETDARARAQEELRECRRLKHRSHELSLSDDMRRKHSVHLDRRATQAAVWESFLSDDESKRFLDDRRRLQAQHRHDVLYALSEALQAHASTRRR